MKKFYTIVDIKPAPLGYEITLDGRSMKTPMGKPMLCPSPSIANAIKTEWESVPENTEINAKDMHFTQLVNTALDKVSPNMEKVRENVVAFCMNDALCYHADDSDYKLKEKQAQQWMPWLDWLQKNYAINLTVTHGISPIEQSLQAKQKAQSIVGEMDCYTLAVVADMCSVYGSFVLALATIKNAISVQHAFDLSVLEDTHQQIVWGSDAQMMKVQEKSRQNMVIAQSFIEKL